MQEFEQLTKQRNEQMQRHQESVCSIVPIRHICQHGLGATFPVSATLEEGALQASRRNAVHDRCTWLVP
jgi:hypothetical protein